MGDIEDAAEALHHFSPRDQTRQHDVVLPKTVRRRRKGGDTTTGVLASNRAVGDSFIPGTYTVYVRTWGCSHNSSDAEYMCGLLSAEGYEITTKEKEKEQAHVWILNSCTVKTPSEDTFNNAIRDGLKKGKKVILAGCVPQAQPRNKMTKDLSIIGVHQIDHVVEVVEETLKGGTVRLLGKKRGTGGTRLNLPKIRKNPLIEIIPINTGCLNQCTYCKTKHARGDLGSYPVEEIVERVQQVIAEGVVEIWLTSEDTGTFGRDIGETIITLLDRIVAVMPKGTMLRLGMTNPPYIKEHLKDIARILRHDRVYSFLHIPIQSGSDAILTLMKREYNREDFCDIVDFLRDEVPHMNVATDIICGFPEEDENDFADTLSVCEKYKFASLFINQFFPRPGTPAASMERVDPRVVKERTRTLTNLFHSYSPYTHQEGMEEIVLVTDVSTHGNYFVAHNKSFDQVLVPCEEKYMGKMLKVRITSTGKHFMIGEVIDEAPNTQALSMGEDCSGGRGGAVDVKRTLLVALVVVLLILFVLFEYL
eukprot:m.21920 g.21920  ORF g.21920 m.21920 type:complete len:535 (+) comp8775_c0_seq1:96-1700(+)